MSANLQKIVFIVGPTASGKSAAACHLAERLQGEIISCDAMQVYKEVSIATNKPSEEMRRAVSHHLIDIVSVQEEFDVARFAALACEAIRDIQARRHIPIIVGGSGLYMQVLLDGIFPGCPKNVPLREDLRAQAQRHGPQFLFDKLKQVDAEISRRIHPHDSRRLIRALEVGLTQRRPMSELQKDREGLWGKYDIEIIALGMDRPWLYERIHQRVDEMFLQGVVGEMKSLGRLPLSPTAGQIIGVREIRGYLNGEYDENQARYLMKLNTRRFAKRQMTWFRREKRLRWIRVEQNDTMTAVAERILAVSRRDDV